MVTRHSDLLGPRSARRGGTTRIRRSIGPGGSGGGDGGGGGFGTGPSGAPFGGDRKRKFGWRTVLLVVVGLIAAGILYAATVVGMAVQEVTTPISPDVAPEVRPAPVVAGERINILAMGLDKDGLRSDTMMLASIDPEKRHVVVIQIPRDTRTLLAGKGTIGKINGAYAFGVGDEAFPGHLRALKTVEDLLDIPIHHTVVIELDGFARAVDKLGGVWVEIPFAMDYDDPDQDLHIHLQPGRQRLMGDDALNFVRFRKNNDGTGYPNGDLGRVATQQEFVRSAVNEVLQPANLPKLPALGVTLAQYVDTTLEAGRILSLTTNVATKISREDIEFVTLPGVDSYIYDAEEEKPLSFWVPDPAGIRQMVDRLIHGIDPAKAAQIHVQVVAADLDDEIQRLQSRLAEQGFVVSVALAEAKPGTKTRVIDLKGSAEVSQFVGRALLAQGLATEIVQQPDAQAMADVQVVLGTGRP